MTDKQINTLVSGLESQVLGRLELDQQIANKQREFWGYINDKEKVAKYQEEVFRVLSLHI